ncbi:MAG TPA: FliH/SctL family protein [Gaiellaceae bacterium]|nr:FliH/SctL family protein [Gaiellaceae bacterium]
MSAPFVFEQLESVGNLVMPTDRAAEMVAIAQANAIEIERRAREDGYEAGRAEMIARAAEEIEAPRQAINAAAAAVYAAQSDLAAAVELRTIEFAIAIAERILGAALAVQPELVCEVVGGALRRALSRDRLVIDVHPDDVDVVRTWLGTRDDQDGIETITVRAERRVVRGGCVVHTTEGEIDGQLTEQLARAEQVLRRVFAESAEAAAAA